MWNHIISFFFQIVVSAIILAAIVVNLLVFFGSTGERWRRVFLMPWLIYYGIGILIAIAAHQWLTTLCWVEEKIYGKYIHIYYFASVSLQPMSNFYYSRIDSSRHWILHNDFVDHSMDCSCRGRRQTSSITQPKSLRISTIIIHD